MRLLPLAVLLVLTGCASGATTPQGAARGGTSSAATPQPGATARVAGFEVIDRGAVPWEDGVVLEDPHVLRVMAVGVKAPPTPCEDAVMIRPVRQSDEEVVLEARQYELADKPARYDCLSIGRGPRPHEVRLDQPLGDRRVVDASAGVVREVIAFNDFPTLQQVPDGYQWRPPTWDDSRRVITRSWGSKDGSLTLEIGPGKQLQPLPAVLKRGRISGEPATVSRVIMLSCVRWGPAERTFNLCSRDAGAGDPPLDPNELLAVGATIR